MLARESDEIVGCGPMSRRYIASTVPASLVLISGWLGGSNCFAVGCPRILAVPARSVVGLGCARSSAAAPRMR